MYIVAIAWLYVTLMMALTEKSVTAGVLTFAFFGLAPCALLLWLFGGPTRKRYREQMAQRAAEESAASDADAEQEAKLSASMTVTSQDMNQGDRADAQPDQGKLGK